jgi:hypothetical protein
VCPFGHGKYGNQINNPGIIKYEDIRRIGITTPVRIASQPKIGRIFAGRPVSSRAGPIKHVLGPALPLFLNSNQSVDHAINIPPAVNSKTYPLNQNAIASNLPGSLAKNPINNSVVIKPTYYDLEVPFYINLGNTSKLVESRKVDKSIDGLVQGQGESVKTRKSHSTLANSKIKVN